jgi:hypothetical protein
MLAFCAVVLAFLGTRRAGEGASTQDPLWAWPFGRDSPWSALRQAYSGKQRTAALFSWGLGQLVFLGLKPPPPQHYPLSDGQAALQSLADGGVLGKLVLER